MSFTFGTRVKVTAEIVPVYVTVHQRMEPNPRGVGMIGTGSYHVDPDSFSAHGDWIEPGEDGTWPGEPVPETPGVPPAHDDIGLEPTGDVADHFRGAHRRLRRIPFGSPAPGVIVGSTRRQEGRLQNHGPRMDPECGPPELLIRRTVPVIQVALDSGGCARVVDVYADDVEDS